MTSPATITQPRDVNICLIAENRLLRDTLSRLLRKQAGICVVGDAGNTEKIREQIVESGCDIVLADCVPGSAISLLLNDLRKEMPQFKILLIGMEDDPETFLKAIYLGARGYVLKDASAAEIVVAVRVVGRGEAACPPNLCMALIEKVLSGRQRKSPSSHIATKRGNCLTHRQVQLMNLVAK